MRLWELFADRIEEGRIGNDEFAKLLEHVKAEFLAQQGGAGGKSRKRRGRPAEEPADLDIDTDLEELLKC